MGRYAGCSLPRAIAFSTFPAPREYPTRFALIGLTIVATLAMAGAYEVVIGFPRRVDARWVRRATAW